MVHRLLLSNVDVALVDQIVERVRSERQSTGFTGLSKFQPLSRVMMFTAMVPAVTLTDFVPVNQPTTCTVEVCF